MTDLTAAIIETGRVLEVDTLPEERREKVINALDNMTGRQREDFMIGVFVWAHEMRWWIEHFAPESLSGKEVAEIEARDTPRPPETPWGDVSGPQWDLAGRLAAGVRILLDGSDFMGTAEMGEGLARVVAKWLEDQAEKVPVNLAPGEGIEFIRNLADQINQGEA